MFESESCNRRYQKKEQKSRSRLTYNERCQIEAFCKVGINSTDINKNKRSGQYSADNVQKRAKNAKLRSRKPRKFANEKLQHFVIRKLKDGWSPEIIAHAWNNMKPELKISVTCIYNFINRRIELKNHVQDVNIRNDIVRRKLGFLNE